MCPISDLLQLPSTHLFCHSLALNCRQKVHLDLSTFIWGAETLLKINVELFLAILRRDNLLFEHFVRIVSQQIFHGLLVHDCIVFVDSIHARQIVDIKEVYGSDQQWINRIVLIQHCLLLFVPVGLQRLQTDVVEPVARRFEPHHLDLTVAELMGQIFVIGNLISRRRDIPKNIRIDSRHVVQGVLLHWIWIFVCGENVIQRKLRLYDLLLEILGKFDRNLVRESVSIVDFHVANETKRLRRLHNLDLQVVLIVNKFRHWVMIVPPRVQDEVCLRVAPQLVLSTVETAQDWGEFRFDLGRHNMMLFHTLFNFANFSHLLVHVDLFLRLICFQGFFKDFVAMLQGEPLESWQELVDNLADLVSIGYRPCKYFDIVFSDQTLRWKFQIFHIKTARALLCFGIGAILRFCTLKTVLLF